MDQHVTKRLGQKTSVAKQIREIPWQQHMCSQSRNTPEAIQKRVSLGRLRKRSKTVWRLCKERVLAPAAKLCHAAIDHANYKFASSLVRQERSRKPNTARRCLSIAENYSVPQQRLYFFPDPQGHKSFRPTCCPCVTGACLRGAGACSCCSGSSPWVAWASAR